LHKLELGKPAHFQLRVRMKEACSRPDINRLATQLDGPNMVSMPRLYLRGRLVPESGSAGRLVAIGPWRIVESRRLRSHCPP
jgi:hypothetical protein